MQLVHQTLSVTVPARCLMCMNDLFQFDSVAVHTIPNSFLHRHEKLFFCEHNLRRSITDSKIKSLTFCFHIAGKKNYLAG